MQIRAEPEKTALPICNYSQILYQFLTFTQNLKRSLNIKCESFFKKIFPIPMPLIPVQTSALQSYIQKFF